VIREVVRWAWGLWGVWNVVCVVIDYSSCSKGQVFIPFGDLFLGQEGPVS
jgi:hypothetical protein